MEPAQSDECAPRPIVIRDLIRAAGRGDIGLDNDQFGLVAEVELLDMLVLQGNFVRRIQIPCQGCQAERGEEGILYGTKQRARRFGERWQDEFNSHA